MGVVVPSPEEPEVRKCPNGVGDNTSAGDLVGGWSAEDAVSGGDCITTVVAVGGGEVTPPDGLPPLPVGRGELSPPDGLPPLPAGGGKGGFGEHGGESDVADPANGRHNRV